MDFVKVSRENVENHIEELSEIGRLGDLSRDGFLRAGWSDEESAMFEYVRKYSESMGLLSCYDEVGNLFLRTDNGFDQVVQVGSHLDSVPCGGNYDGVVGIIAGLEAVRVILKSGVELSKDLEIVVWRGEESATYGVVYKGSRAAFGIAPPEMLDKKFRGQPLRDAIEGQGFSIDCIEEGRATLDQEDIDKIFAHIELHIEQGKKLEKDGVDIGNVSSVRGPCRYLVKVRGEFDHSGATPMGVNYRRDANLAIAHMQVALDSLSRSEDFFGNDLVQTVGEVNSNFGFNKKYLELESSAITKVCGFGYFTLEIRSNDNSFREEYIYRAHKCVREIADRFNVDVDIEEIDKSDALEALSLDIQSKVEEVCEGLGYSSVSMASGAGHDSAVVAKRVCSGGESVSVGMIFIPCRNGKSHCKEEFASVEAIGKGADVLAGVMGSLAISH